MAIRSFFHVNSSQFSFIFLSEAPHSNLVPVLRSTSCSFVTEDGRVRDSSIFSPVFFPSIRLHHSSWRIINIGNGSCKCYKGQEDGVLGQATIATRGWEPFHGDLIAYFGFSKRFPANSKRFPRNSFISVSPKTLKLLTPLKNYSSIFFFEAVPSLYMKNSS